ncbi:MAG: PorP/SprF family type IX secretion system membrane protein [Saprospiraceae bacterium]|nr:PorP/SprF family type IX secretion system membrane protein [Candidatus Vicinibacter affinis]
MRILKIVFFIYLTLDFNKGQSQDISFSQFNSLGSYYNPALTGSFDGNFKVRMINRDHWLKFADAPYRTFGISGDIKFDQNDKDFKGDFLALGAFFISDRGQILDWNKNEMGVSIAYHKLLDKLKKTYLSGGIALGILQRSISYDNIYFEDQFDGLDRYNGSTSEILPQNIHATPDLKFGINYNTQLSKLWGVQIGTGIHYIFKPNFSFYKSLEDINYSGSKESKALIRTNTILNFSYKIDNFRQLFPKLYFATQGPLQILQTGINYRQAFYSLNQTAMHAGIALRSVSSTSFFTPVDFGLLLGFEVKRFIIGMQYDIGLRDAIKYQNPTHSFEISISIVGDYTNEGFICPEF